MSGSLTPPIAHRFVYPPSRRDESVIDDFHGTPVPDPYRWLEEADSPETLAWGDAQVQFTGDYLAEIPARERIHRRLTRLWDYPKLDTPTRRGDWLFMFYNNGLQNQPILYKQRGLDGQREVLLDPNTLSADGTVAVTSCHFSDDGSLMAYLVSSGGSDWQELRVRKVATGQDLAEVLDWCKFTDVAWKEDNSGFYYSRFPEQASKSTGEATYYNRVCWHTLGTAQSEDVIVYERPDAKDLRFNPHITHDNRYLVLTVPHAAINRNRLYYRPLASDGDFIRLIDEPDAAYEFVGSDGDTFYIQTDYQAPKGRLIAIDLHQPDRDHWRELIAETEDTLQAVQIINRQFVLAVLHRAHHQLKIHHLDGTFAGEVPLPTIGALWGWTGERDDPDMFFNFTSYLYPQTIFRYEFASGQLSPLSQPQVDFKPDDYETTQVMYPSKDGTLVSMFLTHKRGIQLDGGNPALLYGYGGYNISLTPGFSPNFLQWIENGGVLAVANLRGGGEYGDAWHRAGMLENKQNTFDDFIAAAEWLIAAGYTRSDRLAIAGGSNGGLLVAMCMLQRPELFGAVICMVPVTDMLRFHRFTAGRFWTDEYGNAEENADHFKFMYPISPVHNVQPGVTYPATMIVTADMDDRVVPMHAKKFAAALQAADSGQNPILLRLETRAGHGLGKPTSKIIDQWTDIFAFIYQVFGLTLG